MIPDLTGFLAAASLAARYAATRLRLMGRDEASGVTAIGGRWIPVYEAKRAYASAGWLFGGTTYAVTRTGDIVAMWAA